VALNVAHSESGLCINASRLGESGETSSMESDACMSDHHVTHRTRIPIEIAIVPLEPDISNKV
jgi:hypothetical protein